VEQSKRKAISRWATSTQDARQATSLCCTCDSLCPCEKSQLRGTRAPRYRCAGQARWGSQRNSRQVAPPSLQSRPSSSNSQSSTQGDGPKLP
jgi:hypothetical protein